MLFPANNIKRRSTKKSLKNTNICNTVVVVTIISHWRSLEYMKPFRRVILVDSRLDFSIKKGVMNNRSYSVDTIYFLYCLIGAPKRYLLVRAIMFDLLWKCVLLPVVDH